jgi:hypothetical protein
MFAHGDGLDDADRLASPPGKFAATTAPCESSLLAIIVQLDGYLYGELYSQHKVPNCHRFWRVVWRP